jgi:hypothetical protein
VHVFNLSTIFIVYYCFSLSSYFPCFLHQLSSVNDARVVISASCVKTRIL